MPRKEATGNQWPSVHGVVGNVDRQHAAFFVDSWQPIFCANISRLISISRKPGNY